MIFETKDQSDLEGCILGELQQGEKEVVGVGTVGSATP